MLLGFSVYHIGICGLGISACVVLAVVSHQVVGTDVWWYIEKEDKCVCVCVCVLATDIFCGFIFITRVVDKCLAQLWCLPHLSIYPL